jgi:Tfp pilus assembly PilM family ATPase
MLAQTFLKLFPPPKFLDTPFAGLDISDDAIRCIEYKHSMRGFTIHRHGMKALPQGVVTGGEIVNREALIKALSELSQELGVHVVKASLPEEKMYLFKTQVPTTESKKEIRQNIEFKLEENVPLTPDEAVFFFDLIPKSTGITAVGGEKEGSPLGVSVAPKSLVISYLEVIKAAGISVLSFEVQAKGIARSLVPNGYSGTDMIVFIMNKKTGIYVVCGGAVCFTSTIAWGASSLTKSNDIKGSALELKKQLQQVNSYWREHGLGTKISRVVFAGKAALTEGLISECAVGFSELREQKVKFELGKVWQNAFSHDSYIPPISYEDSFDYAVAAGLAFPEDNE